MFYWYYQLILFLSIFYNLPFKFNKALAYFESQTLHGTAKLFFYITRVVKNLGRMKLISFPDY